ncbi:hypothetical protein XSR1_310056 [Xenorhabdus szentirmaii DSM 16338]|uniref:Uncharacterized protein n=1 Tax=Xenorhabdus szentirmaii DSM 16338 TaxID=1427518 RepID=W1J0Y0_9GAMM|nr:hypothetical protein XSR1_310056 [Xenorhabdus szentirmaii DSM 16338]
MLATFIHPGHRFYKHTVIYAPGDYERLLPLDLWLLKFAPDEFVIPLPPQRILKYIGYRS